MAKEMLETLLSNKTILEIKDLFPNDISEISAKYRCKAYQMSKITSVLLKIITLVSPIAGFVVALIGTVK